MRRQRWGRLGVTLGGILMLGGCAADDPSVLYAQPQDGRLAIAGIVCDVPTSWERLPDEPRVWAKYARPDSARSAFPAQLTVHYDPRHSGGAVEATLQYWVSQMTAPDGGDARGVALRSRWTTDLATMDMVVVDGIYQRSLGGGPMTGGRTKSEPGYRMIGTVVEGPTGKAFLHVVGPESSARAMEAELRAALSSARRGSGNRGSIPHPRISESS